MVMTFDARRAFNPAAALVVAGAVLLATNPEASGNPVCLFARCTGHACPGCGLTRALAALLRGEGRAAWNLHPLAGLIAVELIAGWVAWIGHRRGWWRIPPGALTVVLALTGVLLVAAWLVRLAAGELPPV